VSDVFCAIDFETADREPDSACAVGVVRCEPGGTLTKRSALIRPPRPSELFLHIHRLPWSVLRDQPPFADVWPTLSPLLDGAAELTAHNAPFDSKVLRACCEAAGLPAPTLPWVCTLAMARQKWPKPLRNSLPEVCARLGIPFRDHHDAVADAEACARVLIALRAGAGPTPLPPHPAPCAGPYLVIGPRPAKTPGNPPVWDQEWVDAGKPAPGWATWWAREGMPVWLPFPDRIEPPEPRVVRCRRCGVGRPATESRCPTCRPAVAAAERPSLFGEG
jgi:DNA polymerase-3 subunit epsilon